MQHTANKRQLIITKGAGEIYQYPSFHLVFRKKKKLWVLREKQITKLRASLSHSVFSSPQQSSTKSASLSMAHQSIIQFPLSTLLFMNKAPRLLHLRQQDATQSEPRTMVPYLEVLILFQPLYTQSNGLLIPENHIVFKSANTNLTPPDTPMSWILQNIKRSIKVMPKGSPGGFQNPLVVFIFTPNPQTKCRFVGQSPHTLVYAVSRQSAAPVFHDYDEIVFVHIVKWQ